MEVCTMRPNSPHCPDCDRGPDGPNRRDFLRTVSAAAAAVAAGGVPLFATAKAHAAPTAKNAAETAVKGLYDSLTETQRKEVCFDWDHKDKDRGLRAPSSATTAHHEAGHSQRLLHEEAADIIHDVFKGLIHPDWYAKVLKQLKDDTGGQEGAPAEHRDLGKPGDGKFELVMTGRHMMLRPTAIPPSHTSHSAVRSSTDIRRRRWSGCARRTATPATCTGIRVRWPTPLFKTLDDKQKAGACWKRRRRSGTSRSRDHDKLPGWR
jgi:hypothetical protein